MTYGLVRLLAALSVVVLLIGGGAGEPRSAFRANPQPRFVPHELLVQFRPGASDSALMTARAAVGAVRHTLIRSADRRIELLTTARSVPQAIALLQAMPQVEFAEPNGIITLQATSNDPFYLDGSQWGMYGDATTPSQTFGSQAGELWARGFTGSSDVYVAMIDSGIDVNHQDLEANIWVNPFDPIDGVDNDGNGFIDDRRGWDFLDDDNSIYDGGPGDLTTDRHGTIVAGIIGAKGGNGAGVAGVNWNVTIIDAKIAAIDDVTTSINGPTTAKAIQAIDYVTDLKTRHGLNIVAINTSWITGNSAGLHQAILRAAKQDILLIAAAGRGTLENFDFPNYPAAFSTLTGSGSETAASYEAVISVAAMTSSGYLNGNWGREWVDMGAPGSGGTSTTPQNGYGTDFYGSSLATAFVTGAAAIYKSMNPSATAQEIRTAVLSQGVVTQSLVGNTVTGRRLDVGAFEVGSLPSDLTKIGPADGARGIGPSVQLSWSSSSGATSYE